MNEERIIYAWIPVRRWTLKGGFVSENGWYWLRWVHQMRAGLLNEWTAYEHKQDGLNED